MLSVEGAICHDEQVAYRPFCESKMTKNGTTRHDTSAINVKNIKTTRFSGKSQKPLLLFLNHHLCLRILARWHTILRLKALVEVGDILNANLHADFAHVVSAVA